MPASDIAAIEAVLQTYFDGLYEGDTAKLVGTLGTPATLREADGTWSGSATSRTRPSVSSASSPRVRWTPI